MHEMRCQSLAGICRNHNFPPGMLSYRLVKKAAELVTPGYKDFPGTIRSL